MAASSSSSLRQLLSLTKSLHESSTAKLSLSQLVSVQFSLLQVAVVGAVSNDQQEQEDASSFWFTQNDATSSTWTEIMEALVDQEDEAFQMSLLSSAEQLFVFQYLLLQSRMSTRPLQALVKLLLPFLDGTILQIQQEENDDDDDCDLNQPQEQDELVEAMLQAIFAHCNRSDANDDPLQDCLEQLQEFATRVLDTTTVGSSTIAWKSSCRILVRLNNYYAQQPMNNLVQQAVAKQLEFGLIAAVGRSRRSSNLSPCLSWIMPPMTNDLLPLLLLSSSSMAVTDGTPATISTVWNQVWTLYRQERLKPERDQHAAVYLIATSVLCIVLPSSIGTTSSSVQQAQTQELWELIFLCVSQGLDPPKRSSSWVEQPSEASLLEGNESEGNAPGLSETKLVADAGTLQLLRRRGLYLLRILSEADPVNMSVWNKYVACYETLEMESTPHLVDQTWETIADIASTIALLESDVAAPTTVPPAFSWKWLKVMLARVMTTHEAPAVRKLSLFRLFTGQAGIVVEPLTVPDSTSPPPRTVGQARQKKVRGRPSKGVGGSSCGIPLAFVTPDFVLGAVLLSFDTLEASVGTNIHFDDDKRESRQDMAKLCASFLCSYVASLQHNEVQCRAFFLRLWAPEILCQISRKTAKLVFTSIAAMLVESGTRMKIPMTDEMLTTVAKSLHSISAMGLVLLDYQKAILQAFSVILAHADPVDEVKPLTILSVLDLFPLPDTDMNAATRTDEQIAAPLWIESDIVFCNLRTWLGKMRPGDNSWGGTFGAGVASAYVNGMLLADAKTSHWDPLVGLSFVTKEMGKAVVFVCALVTQSEHESRTAAGLLWPAIHKGVSQTSVALLGSTWTSADKVARALVLLEYGCKLKLISGMGNGDLVVDRRTQNMMPPPQHIESIIKLAMDFILQSIRVLLPSETMAADLFKSSSARSPVVRQATASFGNWIDLLHTVHEGFPSSSAVSETVTALVGENSKLLSSELADGKSSAVACRVSVIYAALASGAQIGDEQQADLCQTLSALDYVDEGLSAVGEQTSRSIFQVSKWASLSILLTRLITSSGHDKAKTAVHRVLESVDESVHLVSFNAVHALFNCVVVAAEYDFMEAKIDRLGKVVQALTLLANETKNSNDATLMFDSICRLIFRPDLLLAESMRFADDPDCLTPIRDAFRNFIKQAGSQRTHIAAAVLCRMVYGWLGPKEKEDMHGIAAIPYREDIVSLLLFKEDRMDEACVNQTFHSHKYCEILPLGIDDRSITRGFVIAFLSALPDVNVGLSAVVRSDLCDYLIRQLLHEILTHEKAQIMLGSPAYCRRMRGWQALCVLARFLSSNMADEVCKLVMQAFEEQIYGQIRYFLEVFTIQCARMYPEIFGRALLHEIRRTDLSLQHIASLCIVTGALTCGQYQTGFFTDKANVGLTLSGVLPWLGSTQGFARAIAQLLVHKLIPLAVDVSSQHDELTFDSDWYLRSVYNFLDKHDEMKRLRNKQSKFFDSYDADTACSVEGILQLEVDEGGEAIPRHLVAVMKDTLREVFAESNANLAPEWKQVEMMLKQRPNALAGHADHKVDVNFQRKIIPLDALNLALENEKERKLRNRAGRKKQKLIVCASLIDKAPNLAGLARTAEIFAADRLVLPDLRVTQMDNFKSISVTAADWIEIEQCRESDLLPWLWKHKRNGWFVVGLEQTSSSISLEKFTFPDRPILLLLGKEKEGIPVEFLDAVDQCVEIPQIGIIRSLNVHVSGAIAIWEQTRQRIVADKLNLL